MNYTRIHKKRPFSVPILTAVTESGTVRGVMGGNRICSVFKGIPYAAPPVGTLRFRRPEPAASWEGVRTCYTFGPAAYQADRSLEPAVAGLLYPSPYEISEDCLYLNIWTPANSTEDKLPVLFWSHGGGNFGGFGSELENDGEGLAKRGVILVTYNYRLNAFGFLAHPDLTREDPERTSGNYALFDSVAAFQWVRRNIASFGGDPERIFLGGQSAGCRMTACLSVSPLMKGQYAGIMYHSGLHLAEDSRRIKVLSEAEQEGIDYMKAHGCESIEELRALPPEKIMEITEYEKSHRGYRSQILDNVALTKDPDRALFEGEPDDVPIIVLCTADEGKSDAGRRQIMTGAMKKFCEKRLQDGKKPVYAFRFSRFVPGDDLGAYHTSELFYLFETIGRMTRRAVGYDFDLQTRFADYWANFMKTGDPNGDGLPVWKPWTEDCKGVMDLGTADCMIGYDFQEY